ncbi:PEP-CTERM sorting domain-containing protein [Roseateles oligotrophus]|uniref:PEP-CTERM sorting domain-containing protein n=1 Tax=Roseateles oligotrophus TaxID=1769250 RepID=A0ABT2Y9X7_9BURK|nr:PEP-CTERM sorting domain-containing protein [Roseateles oligotrophus]MCV2367107.1 PEP-CTERM sorting domain-containing protein [Roseateles oligotrophus]
MTKTVFTRKSVALAIATVAAMSFGAAQADTRVANSVPVPKLAEYGALSGVVDLAAPSPASSLVVNVAGAQSVGLPGDAGNTVMNFNVGANSTISTVDWNVTLEAFGQSWLADMQVSFSSSAGNDGVIFTPSTTYAAGTASYTGSANLTDLGLAFNVQADGILRVEFSETYKDGAPGVADGQWNSGNITFGVTQAVPEPSTYGLMAMGLIVVGGIARRRKIA